MSAALSPVAEQDKQTYLADLAVLSRSSGAGPGWLRELRANAEARFAEVRFPTTHDEDWKYTSAAPILRVPFRSLSGSRAVPLSHEIESLVPFPLSGRRLIFVGGHYSRALSSEPEADMGSGATVAPLAHALGSAVGEDHLGRHVGAEPNAFAVLNTAFLRDGAVVHVPRGQVVDDPIHIVFLATSEDGLSAYHPRILIVVDEGAQATILESYVSVPGARYFTNSVTELVVGNRAVVRHCRVQAESEAGFHVATMCVRLGRASSFSSFSLSTGAALARSDLNVVLAGEGADCTLDGLYLAGGTQHVDNHTTIDHAAPHGTSRQLYKGVLEGRARAVFNGKVIVRPGSQKTDAQQTNRNLLLSDEATVDTKPQLEIFADDVKCTHGAAIGQLDDEALFYLKSRGVGEEQARIMLTQGFAIEVIGRVASVAARAPLEQLVLSKLRKGS